MKKGLLLILDGYGEAEKSSFNAVTNANTPYLDYLRKNYPHTLLYTHGRSVGLPNGAMGGSEVGHTTIGAGRVVKSMPVKIDDEIESGEFFTKELLINSFSNLSNRKGALHIAGLFSDKQIHSNIYHVFAIINMAKQYGIERVFVHPFTDGRDCSVDDSFKYLEIFNQQTSQIGIGEIATIGGRFYAMDREKNWERTSKALQAMQKLDFNYNSAYECLKSNHNQGITDEFILPARIRTNKQYTFDNNDLIIFFNFRADRMKQPVEMLDKLNIIDIITFNNFYEGERVNYLYDEEDISGTLSEYISSLGLKQLKISESTKYAHVTYFLNGGREQEFEGEDRIHIETEKTNDFASTPKMRAQEIADNCVKALIENKYDLIVTNFSNPDMIGHTGNYEAVVKSLEFLDEYVKNVVETALKENYFVILTADHGNAEEMRDKDNKIQTAHSLNPVICMVIDNCMHTMEEFGGLKDIAPTILKLMQIKPNPKFEGNVLIK